MSPHGQFSHVPRPQDQQGRPAHQVDVSWNSQPATVMLVIQNGELLPKIPTKSVYDTTTPSMHYFSKGKWSPECKRAFDKAKSCVVQYSVLVHYNPDLPLRLAADSSVYGIGAVISHIISNGEERPITFASCTLQPSECNYAQLQKAVKIIGGQWGNLPSTHLVPNNLTIFGWR